MRFAVAFTALTCVVASATVTAQPRWRTLDVSRQLHDSAEHVVRIEDGAGKLAVRTTNEPVLYSMRLRYNEDNGRPVHHYDAASRSLTVGLTGQSLKLGRHMDSESVSELRLALSRAVPVELDLDVGAARADIDLGGLALRDARIRTGASASKLAFSAPNTMRLRRLDIDAGAASFEATDLANANTSDVRVRSGVGSVSLDFGGTWTQDMTLDVDVALGKTAIRVPEDVGVRVDVQRVLAAFDHAGLTRRGGSYYSDNWDSARFRLRVLARTVFGAIEVARR